MPMMAPRPVSSCWPAAAWAKCRISSASSPSASSTSGAGTRKNELITLSEATIKLDVGGQSVMTVAEGNGPVNALDTALRKALLPVYPALGKD